MMENLIVTTIPPDFRADGVFNFAELPKIIYSVCHTEFCSIEDLLANQGNIKEFLVNKYQRLPTAIVIYEALYDILLVETVKSIGCKIVFITEDLHQRSLSALRSAVNASDLVLARFNIIEDLVGECTTKIIEFPLHCSNALLGEAVCCDYERIVDFGQLHCPPVNVYQALVPPDANLYQYRTEWNNIFKSYNENLYTHLRIERDHLFREIRKYSAGFACTYFPYNFSEKCRLEQGEHWASHNTPISFRNSYLVAKYFEIPGAGLLLLADPSGVEDFLSNAGFVEGVNFIPIRREHYEDTLAFMQNPRNHDQMAMIRARGNELVRTRHTISNRMTEYQGHIQELLEVRL